MKKMISALLVLAMMLALLSGCGDKNNGASVDTSDLYKQVMARYTGELEEGAVIKVLENDTAVELGYVDQLIDAFNEAYKDKGTSIPFRIPFSKPPGWMEPRIWRSLQKSHCR